VKKLLIALVLVAALLAGADRLAASQAEQRTATHLVASYGLVQEPTVTIQGFPFLNQWTTGSYQEIDLQAASVPAGQVRIVNLVAQMHDVTIPPFATSASAVAGGTVGRVGLNGTVPFDSLSLPSGFQVSAGQDTSHVRLTGTFSTFGTSASIDTQIRVGVQDGRLVFAADDPNLSPIFRNLIDRQLQSASSSAQLPMGVHLDQVQVAATGLQFSASAQNVRLP
jgi:LmeA-like phospholipid-binding